MPQQQLRDLIADVDRLLVAGGNAAPGDENLRRRARTLTELGEKVPALAQIAGSVQRVVDAPPKRATAALLDLLVVVRQVRSSLAAAGSDGAAEPVPAAVGWGTATSTRDLYPVFETVTQAGSGRADALDQALERKTVLDLRLVGPLLQLLDSDNPHLPDRVAERVLPAFGKALVPDLRRNLDLKGTRCDARRLWALGKIDPAAGKDLAVTALVEGNWVLQVQALKSLAELDPSAAERLALDLVGDKTVRQVRAAALACLGQSRSGPALEALLGALPEADVIWEGGAAALATMPHPQATKRLLDDLQATLAEIETLVPPRGKRKPAKPAAQAKAEVLRLDRACKRAGRVMEVLVKRGDPRGVEITLSLLKHRMPELKHQAGDALTALGPNAKAAVPVLTKALADPDGDVRNHAVLSLGLIGSAARSALAAVAALLQDKDWSIRASAADTLKEFGKGAVPYLVKALQDPNQNTRYTALGALGDMGEDAKPAVGAIAACLKDESREVREEAASALMVLAEYARSALPAMVEAFRDGDALLRQDLIAALHRFGSDAKVAVPAVIDALTDLNNNLRQRAAYLLGELGGDAKEAVPALTKLLKDRDKFVRETAANALASIQPTP
jgi:HEAT repeat protein